MSGPFKVGDVVVCVDTSPYAGFDPAPIESWLKLFAIYRVSNTEVIGGIPGVQLGGDPNAKIEPRSFWHASRFRHLPKADPAFTEAMRALRPEKEGVA